MTAPLRPLCTPKFPACGRIMGRAILLLAAILCTAVSLRAPITELAPILGMIREANGLGAFAAGTLTALPVLTFVLAAPFCTMLSRGIGLERSLILALLFLIVGMVLRSLANVPALFVGTALLGLGIAIANVLVPSLVKRDFPNRVGALTSAYATAANLGSALTSAVIVPIASAPSIGWRLALVAFVPLPVCATIIWWRQLPRTREANASDLTRRQHGTLWRSALAWQVTLFFGFNSTIFYITITWLPSILSEAGYSSASAGSLHALSQLASVIAGLALGILMKRLADQRLLVAASGLAIAIAFLGLILCPSLATIWAIFFGVGSGATFILALAFISLRAANVRQAAGLSTMAQGLGYVIAASALRLPASSTTSQADGLLPSSFASQPALAWSWSGGGPELKSK